MTFSRLDFCFKAAAQLPDIFLSPTTSHSSRLDETAFAKAANIDGTFFEYLDLPGNERQRERFGAALRDGGELADERSGEVEAELILLGETLERVTRGVVVLNE